MKAITKVWRACGYVRLSREEWAVVEDCHEHVIDRWEFKSVQRLLGRNTRTSMRGNVVGPLGGLSSAESAAPRGAEDGPLRDEKICVLRLFCP